MQQDIGQGGMHLLGIVIVGFAFNQGAEINIYVGRKAPIPIKIFLHLQAASFDHSFLKFGSFSVTNRAEVVHT